MTALDTRDDVVLDVDLTQDVPCTLVDGCDRPASSLCTVSHLAPAEVCGSVPSCEPCRLDLEEKLTLAWVLGRRVVCRSHKAAAHVAWRPL